MNVKDIGKNLELFNIIGKGSYGNVYLGKNKINNQYYAVKVISKAQLQSKVVYQYFNNEIYILKHINHPNIVKYISLIEKKKEYWLVIEYCNGGSLVKALKYHITKYNKPVPENIVRHFIKNILTAVIYLNNKNIIHRDIKSDNILLHYDNEEDLLSNNFIKAKIKLIDFGFARYLDENELAGSLVGTPMYMDPNVLKTFLESKSRVVQGFYDQKVDVWSLGILTYELLIGIVPFMSKDIKGLFQNVNKRDFYIPKEEKRDFYLSEYGIKFIDKTLNIDPNLRPLPSELINDPWINNEDGVLYQMKTDDEIKLINNKKLFINFWKPKDKIFSKINMKDKINIKYISLNIDKEHKKKIFMNIHKNKHLFNALNNNNNHKINNGNGNDNGDDYRNEIKGIKNKDKINGHNTINTINTNEYDDNYEDMNNQNINDYQHKKNDTLNNSNNDKNAYKYTKKKPKKIIKNFDLILANTSDENHSRFNTEIIKSKKIKKISNLKSNKDEIYKNYNNNNNNQLTFSNTYTNFNFGEKNDKKTHNKIKIKSINYISNNDDQNQNRNFSQNESYRQYKVYKYISPSKNLFNKSNSNLIHKTWSNNFLYKKKNSFNNSMRKTKNYLKISKEYDDIDDELK
jgi:serine/threonine protein kinase